MTIKEVEVLTSINRANIRFYEKEGLLTPLRNAENNYRTYTDADVQLLLKVKLLRALGISLEEIRQMKVQPEILSKILSQRLVTVQKEKEALLETEKVCRCLLKENLSFDDLHDSIIKQQSVGLQERISLVMRTDLTQDFLSGKQLADIVGVTLLYSLLATNLVFRFLFLLWNPDEQKIALSQEIPYHFFVFAYVILSVLVTLVIGMTAKPFVHLIMLHLIILGQAAAIIGLAGGGLSKGVINFQELFMWINTVTVLAGLHIIIVWLLSRFFKYYRKHFPCAFIPPVVTGLGAWYVFHTWTSAPWQVPLVFTVLSFYSALRWNMVSRDVEVCNRYYAVTAALNMLAIPTLFMGAAGDGQSWRRGGKEYH